jgi:two-component system, OmpR family, response regulator
VRRLVANPPGVPPDELVSAHPFKTKVKAMIRAELTSAAGRRTELPMRILVIEDDRDAATWLVKGLRESGHVVDLANDGEQGLNLALEGVHDVLIVDRMLPKLDGLSVIQLVRERGQKTPVLILSALSDVDERVKGLRAGGDDYLAKPYAFAELLARVEGLGSRKLLDPKDAKLKAMDLEIDLMTRSVSRAGKTILLQPREFKLLEYLMRNAGHIVTRTMLLENVWDYHFDPQTNVIDVHVSRLRGKIDKGFDEALLQTVRGAGYMIRAR